MYPVPTYKKYSQNIHIKQMNIILFIKLSTVFCVPTSSTTDQFNVIFFFFLINYKCIL